MSHAAGPDPFAARNFPTDKWGQININGGA
jgi:hypothetical protein